jgi:hypothetical protein
MFLMKQNEKLYKFLSQNYVDDNWEKTTDKYGNVIETFLIIDDCAICFLFNPDGELIYTWHA